jgi:uncharacterized protein (DUF2141 family)
MLRKSLPLLLLLGLPLALAPVAARADGEGQLNLRIEKLRNDKGRVLCLLFSAQSQDGFPLDPKKALASAEAKVQGKVAVCEFKGIAPGNYAICGFHDENGNEELDLGVFGIPKEGIVSSRNAPARFGPPKFKDAVFEFAGSATELRAKIHYYL